MALNIERLTKVGQKMFPQIPEATLKAKITQFAKAYPNLSDNEAFSLFLQTLQKMKHPVVSGALPNNNLQNYLGAK